MRGKYGIYAGYKITYIICVSPNKTNHDIHQYILMFNVAKISGSFFHGFDCIFNVILYYQRIV